MPCVQALRIHDPVRRPASWTEIIGREQFVAFAKNVDTGAPCDAGGQAFADPSQATCVLFESLAEARAFCEAAAQSVPIARFDVFDAEGRAKPPLLTFVHPSRAQVLDADPRALHKRRTIAWGLIAGGIPLIIYAGWRNADIEAIFPGVIGINLLIAGARLLWLNLGIRETERARQERLKRIDG
jgi:hypothetical protein